MESTLHHLSHPRVDRLRREAELFRLARTSSPRRSGGRRRRAARTGEDLDTTDVPVL